MAVLTVRNVPAEVHRALRVRAALRGRSTEAEIRSILEDAVLQKGRVQLGSMLYSVGRQVKLTDEEFDTLTHRDRSPAEPIEFE